MPAIVCTVVDTVDDSTYHYPPAPAGRGHVPLALATDMDGRKDRTSWVNSRQFVLLLLLPPSNKACNHGKRASQIDSILIKFIVNNINIYIFK
jgi:hypothetical protein